MLCLCVSCDIVCLHYSFGMSKEISNIESAVTSDQVESEKSSDNDPPNKTSFLRKNLSSFSCTKSSSSKSERSSDVDASIHEESWTTELDLIINCVGFSVGLGNLWRFPYVAYKHGGGAFLIPYLISTFLISFPMYYAELLIGQISRLDAVSVWSFCPFFKGVGITIIIVNIFIQIYYNVVMGYALFYWIHTFHPVLPWSKCLEWWGADDNCYDIRSGLVPCRPITEYMVVNGSCTNATETSMDQFWKIYVLDLSTGLEDPGNIKWNLVLVLFVTWTIVCALVILRHHMKPLIRIKTIYFTALCPFLILAIFFMYAFSLPGAMKGLAKLFVPKWKSLVDITVWSEAVQASLNSAGLGMGGIITFGSKNTFCYNTSRCAFITIFVDLLGAILAAAVTFMVVGFLAVKFHFEFSKATLSSHGLVFITFPEVVTDMFVPQLWSFAFFTMLFCLALDASVDGTQTLVIGFNTLLCPANEDNRLVAVFISALLFLAGLSCITNGGPFLLHIMDNYAGGYSLMGAVMVESLAFGWGYGIKRASEKIKIMQGSEPNLYMKICWGVLAPLSLIVFFFYTAPYTTLMPLYDIPYPSYANIIGWAILGVSLVPVPVYMVIVLLHYRKSLSNAFKPDELWKTAVREVRENDV